MKWTVLGGSALLTQMDVIETIWDCGIWDQKYTYNVNIIQEFRNKALWFIVNAPQYVPTTVIGRDIKREQEKLSIVQSTAQKFFNIFGVRHAFRTEHWQPEFVRIHLN